MRLTLEHRLDLAVEERQEQRPEVRAIGERMAEMLGVQREIRGLLGRPSMADQVWARATRRGR